MVAVALFGSSPYIQPLIHTLLNSDSLDFRLFITKPGQHYFTEELIEQKVRVYSPENLKSQYRDKTLLSIKELNIDIVLVADYGLMIPNEILQAPKHGCVNIHFSMLPKYRGASPVQYSILHGDYETAYSYIEMAPEDEPNVDSGRIIHQTNVILDHTETTESLYTKMFSLAATELENIIAKYISKEIEPISQNHSERSFTTPSGAFDRTTLLKKEDAYVSADKSDEYIEQAVRAFTPWPRAWTSLDELLKIGKRFDSTISKLLPKKDPRVRVQILKAHLESGKIVIDDVQADGKKPTQWKEFKNGYFQ